MLGLIHGLAHMCSLRDREALDAALVALVQRSGMNQIDAVRLVRLVGNEDDLRCLVKAEQSYVKAARPQHSAWTEWRDLPPLTGFPARLESWQGAKTVRQGTAPCVTVVPLGFAKPCVQFLEIESRAVLPREIELVIEGILTIFQNFEHLLDYGEKDALTELLNRKSFDASFFKATVEQNTPEEIVQADRRQLKVAEGYWLAVLDIDHFKRVNDNFGHLIGDEVLLLMARLMRSSFRFHDQLYRFGGEEFVILMRCAGHDDAQAVLNRFRRTVEAYAFPQVGTITVSIGFAPLQGDDTPSAAFGRADKAVYFAKGHGRNQVCSYPQLVAAGDLEQEVEASGEADFF